MKTLRIVVERDWLNSRLYYSIEKRWWWFPFWVFCPGTLTYDDKVIHSAFDTMARRGGKAKIILRSI